MNQLHDLMAKMRAIEESSQKVDEVNPHHYDSDVDYYAAVNAPAKARHHGKQSPGVNQDDEAYFREIFRKNRLAKQHAERTADHDRLATGTNEEAEAELQECGDAAPQGGQVTMSMQDLLMLVKGLEQAKGDVLLGDEEEGVEEEYGNSVQGGAEAETLGVDAVTPTGDDLASKGSAAPLARALGTNALRGPMAEGLAERLQELYNSIKESK